MADAEVKQEITHVEGGNGRDSDQEASNEFTPAEEKRIKRRIDRRLVTTCGVMYCISLIDRTNLSSAAIAGMNEDLMLVGDRYSILVLLFFITYTLLQPPATIMLRRVGPRPFLAGICFSWGVVMLGHGFVNVWWAMTPLRVLLGAFEAGFFPSCLYLISTWFSRYELHRRYSFFYLIGVLASGFSGVLAYGLMQMDGLSNYRGWRWMKVSCATMIIACVGYFTIVDFPDRSVEKSWNFLSEREYQWVIRKIAADRDDADIDKFDFKKWAASGLILKFGGLLLSSALSPRHPTPLPIFCLSFFEGFTTNIGSRYFGVFMVAAAANTNLPTIMAYQANNIRGQWKRAFCSATLVGFGGIGGIAGSLVFRTQDSPLYRPGIYATITCNSLVIIIVGLLSVHFRRCNKKADQGLLIIEGLEGFRYTI
uniref:Major facilitator superfamily (MFS) profile domain-containing protein n=1 Tax=Bionectria ochroleuca TaxID=29856 RepID=A0A8H7K9P8_BIOOC